MTICSEICKNLMMISEVKGLGEAKLRQISKNHDLNLSLEDLAKLLLQYTKLEIADITEQLKRSQSFVEKQIDYAIKHNAKIICSLDNDYPLLLKMSKFNPVILYVKGTLAQSNKAAAVIGSREPPAQYDVVASRITEALVKKGCSIVSGLAVGCDTFAHRAALNAGGHTVAVLGHGLDTIYPKENAPLAEEIVNSGGALVSQFPFGTEVMSYNFAKRDDIQAGLSRLVVMIASGEKGGSLIASKAILDDNRHLFVPAPLQYSISNEKVAANLIFTSGIAEKISTMLKFKKNSNNCLKNLHILKSKDDYVLFDNVLNESIMEEEDSLFAFA